MVRIIAIAGLVGALTLTGILSDEVRSPQPGRPRPMPASVSHADGGRHAATHLSRTRIIGATTVASERVRWAIQRFAHAGLDLPDLVVRSHTSYEPCRGNQGIFRRGSTFDTVELCTESMPVILHELAHAWESHFATDRARSDFLDAAGLDHWAGADVPYAERGIEASAQAVAWALAERPLTEFDVTLFGDELEAYRILTGRTSPRLLGEE